MVSSMIGRTISHYRVLERLGGGGMGEVFLAADLRLDREVALKFLPASVAADDDAKQRFLQEARAASALDHPNVCTVFDIDETENGRFFLAMAHYRGQSVKQRLVSGPLPIKEALDLTAQVARGLAVAHAAGIVHRDIKPANLMMAGDGMVKIVDFGLAKLVGEPGVTRSGHAVGTPAYMSPEQANGEEVDHRTDLWSLGIVLYEVLAGHCPFEGPSDLAVLRAILSSRPPPLGRLRPNISPRVLDLIDALLAHDRELRLSEARLVVERLSGAVDELASGSGLPTIVDLPLAKPVHLDEADFVPSGKKKRIIVLPFDNLGPPEHEYFAAGMTEEITSRLAAFQDLGVISRTTSLHLAGSGKSITEIGAEIGVDWVLEGSVRWAPAADGGAGRVRITPQLIRVADDLHAWAASYTAALEDVFTVQSDIAEEVIDHLEVVLDRERPSMARQLPTENTEAYNAYLRGLYDFEKMRLAYGDGESAVTSLERAVHLDPKFALAWSLLARVRTFRYVLAVDHSESNRAVASAAAERALRLAPKLPAAHLAMGYFRLRCEMDDARAMDSLQLAKIGLPNDDETVGLLATILRHQGRWNESTDHLKRAVDLNPTSVDLQTRLAVNFNCLRQYEQTLYWIDRAIARAPEHFALYGVRAWAIFGLAGNAVAAARSFPESTDETVSWDHALWLELSGELDNALQRIDEMDSVRERFDWWWMRVQLRRGQILQDMAREEEARATYTGVVEALSPLLEERETDPLWHVTLGLALSGLGRRAESIRHGQRATELAPIKQDPVLGPSVLSLAAEIYARVGDAESACAAIGAVLSVPWHGNIHLYEKHPGFANLRELPCFEELRRRHPPGFASSSPPIRSDASGDQSDVTDTVYPHG